MLKRYRHRTTVPCSCPNPILHQGRNNVWGTCNRRHRVFTITDLCTVMGSTGIEWVPSPATESFCTSPKMPIWQTSTTQRARNSWKICSGRYSGSASLMAILANFLTMPLCLGFSFWPALSFLRGLGLKGLSFFFLATWIL